MSFEWTAPTPLEYFATLVQSDAELPLLEAAASLAQDAEPGLDLQAVLADVDRLTRRLRRDVTAGAAQLERLHVLGEFFFAELGFGGNLNDYYNANNSYLQVVLAKRRGIPISLGLLWLELAQAIGLKASGVNFPGHFLVQADVGIGKVVIDPFDGRSLSERDLLARLEELIEPALIQSSSPYTLAQYLRPAAPRAILVRMLRNLQHIHRSERQWQLLVAVQDRLITLLPRAWAEYRDRALAWAELGERQRARADLSRYLSQATAADDRARMLALLDELGGWVQ